MLSYRHAFHAGNHADVLKHCVLVQMVRYFGQKDKAFWVIDTHAGAGAYSLATGYALRLAEFKKGIGRLWARTDLPAPLADYVGLVRGFNGGQGLRSYPGSPLLALWTIRAQDRLRLFELHGKDAALLRETLQKEKRVLVEPHDGFAGLKALLPPPPRRAIVLIDPSYEESRDYERVLLALRDALTRFPDGSYAVWYPQLTRLEACELLPRLKKLPVKNWLNVGLRVKAPASDGFGLHGSGLFVINPPWTLHDTLAGVMPFLAEALADGEGAGYVLESGGQRERG